MDQSLGLGVKVFGVYRILLTVKCLKSVRSFGAFLIFDNLLSRTYLVVEQNGPNFGPQR